MASIRQTACTPSSSNISAKSPPPSTTASCRPAKPSFSSNSTEPDADEVDPQSVFLWTEEDGRVVAFLRIIPAGIVCAEASVGRVLVDAGYRRRGLCRRLMHEALQHIALTWGPQPVRISAQEYLAGFYASLGFEAVSGTYLEAGIPHVRMLRR